MADDSSGKGGGSSSSSGGGSLNSAFSDASGAVSDIFSGFGDEYKATGDRIEQGMYTEAAGFADQNEKYTEASTNIKEMQQQRDLTMSLGKTQAQVAGAGFQISGSAGDLLRMSAQQGALDRAVTSEQGYISEQGYKEQGDALRSQADAAGVAADAADTASTGSFISAGIKGVAAIAQLAAL